MSIENSKLLMNRFLKFINTASEQLASELISPDAIFFIPGQPESMRGPTGYLKIIGMMRSGFPDIQWTLEDSVAEGDKVAARFTMRGTHNGNFFRVPPTGKSIEVQAMNFYLFSNGKIVEEFGQPDMLGLLQQIGAFPGSTAAQKSQ
jgi:Predicted ester cyclase